MTTKIPTPAQIIEARGQLTQTTAAALIGESCRTWQRWEAKPESKSSRKMRPALFELFLLKVNK